MELEIPEPPSSPTEIERLDASLVFPGFTAQTAWTLGVALRTRLLALSTKPAVIDISLAHGNHCLFHATTHSGTSPDNDNWVTRKRNAVLRFGVSTWFLQQKFAGDEAVFAAKYNLGSNANQYAIHGGGWPVRVQGVEGVVAVVVVSGLQQQQDHSIIVQTVQALLDELRPHDGLDKKKED